MKILYVEDDASLRESVELMLRSEGYDYDSASSGEEALELAESKTYDLIMIDIMLPDLDGYQIIGRLRHAGVKTPFLLQTGLLERGQAADTGKLGVTTCLIKPFDKKEMVERIEKAVAQGNADPTLDPASGTPLPVTTERREHRRFPVVKSAWLVAEEAHKVVVLNLSYGGALVRLPADDMELPTKIGLAFESSSEIACEIRWREGRKVGLKFLG